MNPITFILIFLLFISCTVKKEGKIENIEKSENKNEIENMKVIDSKSKNTRSTQISIDYLKIDTVFFLIDNKNSNLFGYNKWSSRGWGYTEVINDSILFAFDDLHNNMKLLNVYTNKIDTVVNHDVDYDFQGFKEVRGELVRQTHNFLYRFDAKLNLKDSISVSEYLSDDYAQCDYVDNKNDNLFCINILYQKGFEKTKIKKEELTKIPDLERINDSTLQYGINLYKVKQLPKNTTFIFHSKNKIYSVYDLKNKYMLLIYTYDSIKGY